MKKGEPVGFRVREGGGVVGVAGDAEFPVADGTYEWELKPDPGQTNPGATALLIVAVVVAVVGITAAIIAIKWQHDFDKGFGRINGPIF